jgi:hypothetical protein
MSLLPLAALSLTILRKKMDAAKPLPRGVINHSKHNPHGQPLEEVSYRLFLGQF